MSVWILRCDVKTLAALCMAVVGLLAASPAAAARYAVLIGANQGQPGETPLRFAVADAERMAQVLQNQGGFLAENTIVLRQPTPDRVRSVLGSVNARIRNEASDGERVLLVFYSGHADATAIHVGAATLPWSELRDLTLGSAANTRLLIVDACRSGAATRVKGVALDKPFALPRAQEEVPDGFAILSSAAEGEFAQESDSIGSSFFTFHLTAALQGLGDHDADGSVTLAEAFDYTSDRTMASTAATLAGIQHPTYKYELKGRSSFVLTRPGLALDRMVKVTMPQPGVYLWREENAAGRLVLEANVAKRPRTVWLAPGAYHVQRRGTDRFYEGNVNLAQGREVDTAAVKMRAIGYDQLVRKGGKAESNALAARFGLSSAWLETYEPSALLGLHYAHARADFTLDFGYETLAASASAPQIEAHVRGHSLFAGASKLLDVSIFSLGLGVRAGASALHQRFDTEREAPSRWRLVPFASMLAVAAMNLPFGTFAAVESGLTVTRLEVIDNAQSSRDQVRVVPWACLEMGKRF